MDYKTDIQIDVQEAFDSLRKNEQIEFLKDNIASLLSPDELWELLSTDDQQRIVENCAEDFGFVENNGSPREFGLAIE